MDLEDAAPVNFVLHDRDVSFTLAFDAVFRAAGADHPLRGPGAANEFDYGTVRRQLPSAAADGSCWTAP
jgi:hypothetical protein